MNDKVLITKLMRLYVRVFFMVVVFVVSGWIFSGEVLGMTTVMRESVPYDLHLSDQSNNEYAPVDGVAVVRISPPEGIQYGDSEEWIKGFYYYSITKLGFSDIPFNYVVTWDGGRYEGKGGGVDVCPGVDWVQSEELGNFVLVAYFDDNREMTNSGSQALQDTVSYILTRYGIKRENVYAVDASIADKPEDISLSSLIVKSSKSSDWVSLVHKMQNNAEIGSKKRKHEGSVVELNIPESVGAGENFVANVDIKNNGEFPWYKDGLNAVYVATSDPRSRESKLFVSDKWSSFTRVVSMTEEWVLPGDVAKFEFEINTPLISGKYSEKFEILVLPEEWIQGTQFEVSFSVEKGDLDLIEILDTETGSLNVRDCASTGCKELGMVVPGDILIKLGKDGNWYKIRWGEDKEGWVYGKYVKDI